MYLWIFKYKQRESKNLSLGVWYLFYLLLDFHDGEIFDNYSELFRKLIGFPKENHLFIG